MTVHVQGPVEGRRTEAAARDAEVVRWRKLRAGGRSAFVWRHGVVGWGLPAALVTAAYKVIERLGLGWPSELPPELHVPPMYYTKDWTASRDSVRRLAALDP